MIWLLAAAAGVLCIRIHGSAQLRLAGDDVFPAVGHVAGWHLVVSTLQAHRNGTSFSCLSPFREQGTVSLGLVYLRRWCVNRGKARRTFLLAACDLDGPWPTVSGTMTPYDGSVGIEEGPACGLERQ